MTLSASVVTCFGNEHWPIYGQKMLSAFKENFPPEVALCVFLDNDLLIKDVQAFLRPQDAVIINDNQEHKAWLERHKDKEHPTDYRKQPLRFSHKVFALKACSDFWKQSTAKCQYLIWMDADVITTRKVTLDDIRLCLPKEGDKVSYLGRRDWPHSECGWVAFDLLNGGHELIEQWHMAYTSDAIFAFEQWHDSFVFDRLILDAKQPATNLTEGKPGIEIWPHSPMAAWSKHYKGPEAKKQLVAPPGQQQLQAPRSSNIKIQTKNSIPNEQIQRQILENMAHIQHWIGPCKLNDEEIVVVSAGPQLIAEDLREEVKSGRRIVAVKHALEPLKAAGITPWACILLDPRPHLYKFVENPDTSIIWFVASQVYPAAVKRLVDAGCTVWGYHAAVGADEQSITEKHPGAVVSGGSATATRGLFMLERLGFRNFRLYGYDLCFADKPDMKAIDNLNQPAHFDFAVTAGGQNYLGKRSFWTKAELIAQFEEINQIIQMKSDWKVKAFGGGIVPFVYRAKEVNDLRTKEKMYKLYGGEFPSYEALLGHKWPNKKTSSAVWRKWLPRLLPRPSRASSF